MPYIALQLRGAGYVFNVLSSSQIDPVTGGSVLGIVVILYVFMGGLKAAALTDTVQGVLLLIGVTFLALTAIGFIVALVPDKGFLWQWNAGFLLHAWRKVHHAAASGHDVELARIFAIAFATFDIYTSPSFYVVVLGGFAQNFQVSGAHCTDLSWASCTISLPPPSVSGNRSIA